MEPTALQPPVPRARRSVWVGKDFQATLSLPVPHEEAEAWLSDRFTWFVNLTCDRDRAAGNPVSSSLCDASAANALVWYLVGCGAEFAPANPTSDYEHSWWWSDLPPEHVLAEMRASNPQLLTAKRI